MTSGRHDSATTPFRIVVGVEGERQVLTPHGELDLTTVPQLERRLMEALAEGETVLDLSGVVFIDSSGIALLVSVSRTARENAWRLQLRDPSPHVERLIELTCVGPLLGSPGAEDAAADA
jgi:anti-sigma B factor antagonist